MHIILTNTCYVSCTYTWWKWNSNNKLNIVLQKFWKCFSQCICSTRATEFDRLYVQLTGNALSILWRSNSLSLLRPSLHFHFLFITCTSLHSTTSFRTWEIQHMCSWHPGNSFSTSPIINVFGNKGDFLSYRNDRFWIFTAVLRQQLAKDLCNPLAFLLFFSGDPFTFFVELRAHRCHATSYGRQLICRVLCLLFGLKSFFSFFWEIKLLSKCT